MELSELHKRSIRVVEADFDGMPIKINANAITGSYCAEAATKIKDLDSPKPQKGKTKKKPASTTVLEFFEGRGKEIEDACDLYAKLIKGSEETPLLLEWDLTDQGEPVECSVGSLRKLHLELLRDLWGVCLTAARPKLQETRTTATNRTISDNTVAITSPQDTQTDASLTM